ncbi:hypothetical protein M153_16970001548 [Pseudoloma neurophilia]|uniref:Uncharacterized protein n=1 Tax=Pseudoloma neurophilia TaxID=146866 RepID=A0A0R0LUD8_9MICR|nr:hypothetical protein M153_16970001548 [Pseudoloma neurophilia]
MVRILKKSNLLILLTVLFTVVRSSVFSKNKGPKYGTGSVKDKIKFFEGRDVPEKNKTVPNKRTKGQKNFDSLKKPLKKSDDDKKQEQPATPVENKPVNTEPVKNEPQSPEDVKPSVSEPVFANPDPNPSDAQNKQSEKKPTDKIIEPLKTPFKKKEEPQELQQDLDVKNPPMSEKAATETQNGSEKAATEAQNGSEKASTGALNGSEKAATEAQNGSEMTQTETQNGSEKASTGTLNGHLMTEKASTGALNGHLIKSATTISAEQNPLVDPNDETKKTKSRAFYKMLKNPFKSWSLRNKSENLQINELETVDLDNNKKKESTCEKEIEKDDDVSNREVRAAGKLDNDRKFLSFKRKMNQQPYTIKDYEKHTGLNHNNDYKFSDKQFNRPLFSQPFFAHFVNVQPELRMIDKLASVGETLRDLGVQGRENAMLSNN